MALSRENKFNPPPQAPKDPAPSEPALTLDEFYGQAILMALARIYDVLLVQIAQSDEDLAAELQAQHYAGGYLFPTIHPPSDPAPADDEDEEPIQ